jgi:hypothetical protein
MFLSCIQKVASLALGERFCFYSARPPGTVTVMYQPDHFRVEDLAQMHALMRARPFAALVSLGSLGLYATHRPTVLKDEGVAKGLGERGNGDDLEMAEIVMRSTTPDS